MKTCVAAAAAVLLLALTGCAGTPDEASSEPQAFAQTTQEPAAPTESTPASEQPAEALPSNITQPGEVCDPSNMNDPICAAFYPDQAVLNITARASELGALTDAEKIERAHAACSGGEPVDSPLYKAGTIAYCNELAPGIDGQPDRYALLIAFYKGLGEDGAKAHYADRVMPTPAELGY